MSREETIGVSLSAHVFERNHFLAAKMVTDSLMQQGVPVIGPVGIISVETGKLTMAFRPGVHGQPPFYEYRWTGVPLPQHMRKKTFTLEKTLAQAIEQENEL